MNANSATKPRMMSIKNLARTVLWAFSNLVVQCDPASFDDRIPQPC
jgi:hypothetical protein